MKILYLPNGSWQFTFDFACVHLNDGKKTS